MGSMPFNTIHILGCSSSMREEPTEATRNPEPPRPQRNKKKAKNSMGGSNLDKLRNHCRGQTHGWLESRPTHARSHLKCKIICP